MTAFSHNSLYLFFYLWFCLRQNQIQFATDYTDKHGWWYNQFHEFTGSELYFEL